MHSSVMEKGTAVRRAARLYGVPLTTLRDRVDKRVPVDAVKSGPDPVLSELEEARLIEHIDYICDMGYGYSRTQVIELASDLAVHFQKREKSKPLGRMWFSGFKKRWQNVKLTKPRGLSSVRAKAASPETVQAYYTELEKILEKYNLKNSPESIYNIDEKGINTEHNPPYVVSSTNSTPQAVTSSRGQLTTILGCGNAIGQQLPPFYVFAGVRKLDHLIDGALSGTDFSMSESGWSNSDIFETYLKNHFARFAQPKEGEYLLVLYDGHKSHVTLSLIDWAREHRIILFVLPPHCSHILQPLDIGCFGPLETAYNKECSIYLRQNPGQEVSRLNVCKLSSRAYSLALSPENLRASFRKAGIYPFDRTAVPDTKLKPSAVFREESMETKVPDMPSQLFQPSPTVASPAPTCGMPTLNHHDDDNLIEMASSNIREGHVPEPVEFDPESTGLCDFFQERTLKAVPSKKKRSIKCLSKIVGGQAIAEDTVVEKIKEFKSQADTKIRKKRTPTKSTDLGKKQ